MTGTEDPQAIRAAMLDRWEGAAPGWAARRDQVREWGMAVSEWMLAAIAPEPGQRVLELAAGVGDTGLLAAERILPGGTLVSSDATEGMLEAARARARELDVENVEFLRLELEWIDLPAASVDSVLCRWGLMLVLDPGAALSETRRVLRPGGRLAIAVWDVSDRNPWATIPTAAMVALGHAQAPDPSAPGMFVLSAPGRLTELLQAAGFTEVTVDAVDFERRYGSVDDYLAETSDLSRQFGDVSASLSDQGWAALRTRIAELAAPFTSDPGGVLRLPARSLVASASA